MKQLPVVLALFFVGAFAMRGAGCTWNDITDRDLDAKVERTRSRPIPAGQVSVAGALVFLVLQALVGLAVLLQFNRFAIMTGLASLAIVAVYPFMKRITWWPQVVLGLAFSWGALMGFAVMLGSLGAPAFVLYAGSIAWVIGYDTIYAHQDREDDALIGVKSTARLFGERTPRDADAVLRPRGHVDRRGDLPLRRRLARLDRPVRLCAASRAADARDPDRRRGAVPASVPVQSRCGIDVVCGACGGCVDAECGL